MSPECKSEWLRHKKPDAVPDMWTLIEFLKYWKKELAPKPTAHSIQPATVPSSAIPPKPPNSSPRRFRSDIAPPPRKMPSGCPACKEQHGLLRCPTFNAMDVDRRNKLVREHRLCLNCFSSQHGYRSCLGRLLCKTCSNRHHTMLHKDREPNQQPTTTPATTVPSMTAAPSTNDKKSESRFLLTATVTLENKENIVKARAILDTGAAVSFMTEETDTALKLKRTHNPIQVTGTTGDSHCKFSVSTNLYSHEKCYAIEPINVTVLPKLPTLQVPTNHQEILNDPSFRSYKLADPDLGGRIDLLLGVTDSLSLFTGEAFKVNGLIAMPTQVGLCLSGPLLQANPPPAFMAAVPPTDLQEDFGRLWEVDQVPEAPLRSPEDEAVLTEFDRTYRRVNGCFSVSLPKKSNPPQLGYTRKQALSRLLANERSLSAKEKLQAFSVVVREYLDLGHAHIIPKNEIHLQPYCYLPVHGVLKDSSTTTKVRAVFDASARSSSGSSLNDCLLPGPNLYPPLQDILLRFRRHPVGMLADISKMFQEILLNPEERDFHRFLVRNQTGAIIDCWMERLTFGVKCSPFLATHVLRTLAKLHAFSHTAASSAVMQNFYVDDFLAGARDVEAADALRKELCDLLGCAGMVLRKWRSNSEHLLNLIPEYLHDSSPAISLQPPNRSPKALGLHRDVKTDCFHVSVPETPP